MSSPEAKSHSLFVGRAREFDALRAGLTEALAGHGRLFMIVGDPGIGKTRLADELTRYARTQDASVLWGRCWEGEGAPAFWPWVQALRAYVRDSDGSRLRAEIGAGAAAIAQLVPDVLQHFPDLPLPPVLEPAQARFRLFDSVSMFLRNAARRRPLVLILDDLHWADESSIVLLQFLAHELREASLLVVGTYRDVEISRDHPLSETLGALARDCSCLVLRGLAEEDVARFIEGTSGVKPAASLVAAVCEKTEGNPFFVSEIVRLLDSEGRLQRADPCDSWNLSIPHGVRETIRRRLERLSVDSRQLLAVVSVIGREFGIEILEAVGARLALHCGPTRPRLLEALEEAVASRLLAEVPRSVGRYRFSHALVRETLCAELTGARRLTLHRSIAAALEDLYGMQHEAQPWTGSGQVLAELAHHFFEAARGGDEVDKAIDYARRAAERACTQLAYEEAAAHYERALAAVEFQQPADEQKRCALLVALGETQMHAVEARMKGEDTFKARATLQSAADLAQRIGAAQLLARAALAFGGTELGAAQTGILDPALVHLLEDALSVLGKQDSALRVRVLGRLTKALYWSEATERRAALSEQALAMARRLDDPVTLAHALFSRRWGMRLPEELDARLAEATEMVQLADTARDPELSLAGRAWLIVELMETGDVGRADAEIAAYGRLAAEIRVRQYQWRFAVYQAMRAIMEGRFEQGERFAQEALAMAQGSPYAPDAMQAFGTQLAILRTEQGRLVEFEPLLKGFIDQYPALHNWRAGVALFYCEIGRLDDARQEFERLAANDFANLPRDSNWINTLALLAETCACLGDTQRAARLYTMLLPCARRTLVIGTVSGCWGSISRWLGVLAATLSRWEDAAGHFECALEMNARMGALPWVAHTQYEYGRMLLARGTVSDREKALALLRAACATFAALGMASRLEKARALIEVGGQALGAGIQRAEIRDEEPLVSGAGAPENTFGRDGSYWDLTYARTAVRVRHTKGLQYVAYLLGHPGREFHVADLLAAIDGAPAERRAEAYARMSTAQLDEQNLHVGVHAEQVLSDARARAEYRQRLQALRDELNEAEQFNDAARATRVREEIDCITTELATAYGLAARGRGINTPVERARKAVTNRIRDALARIQKAHPSLWRHLVNAIKTGTFCSYAPDKPTVWKL